jgi:8-oxoguanine deaminase
LNKVGTTTKLPQTADETLDLQGRHLVLPGFVNTPHHFFQTLTKAIPAAQNSNLFGWLKTLFPLWANLSAEGLYIGPQMAAAELMLSSCNIARDRRYIFPNDCTLDRQIQAAHAIAIRFHASRGSLSKSQGGLAPDHIIENESTLHNFIT